LWWTARRALEGGSFNVRENARTFIDVHDRASREPKDANALALKPPISRLVVSRLLGMTVTFAVHLDREFRGRTIIVEDVVADRMLTPKP
jgi:hypothetical protein